MSELQRVLLVEDDPDIAELIQFSLEQFGGLEVEHRPNGMEALAALETLRPDLIILDYRMPGMNGAEVLGEINQSAALRHIPVVFMTASVMPHHVQKLRALGALDVIAKPFDPMTLADKLREICERTRAE